MSYQFHLLDPKIKYNDEKDDVVLRIRKMLDRGLHPETPEAEAERSLRLAQREMNKYNLDQQKVLESTKDESPIRANVYSVKVTNSKGNKPTSWRWMIELANICANAFSVKTCWFAHNVKFDFYGLETSSAAAADTFLRYGEYISTKTSLYQPHVHFLLAGVEKYTAMRSSRDSYRLGVLKGMDEAQRAEVCEEKSRENKLREYVELYEHLQQTPDDDLELVVHQLAIDLGLESEDQSLEIVLYTKMEVAHTNAIKNMTSQFFSELKTETRGPPPVRSWSSFERGRADGKRMKISETREIEK